MAVHVDLKWRRPILLKDGSEEGLIYTCNLDRLEQSHGCYVFCRRWGKSLVPVYVGQASNIRRRIKKHFNNLKLMVALQHSAKGGDRVLLHGTIKGRPGQRLERTLNVAERALIEKALSDGHQLVNIQGTKRRSDELNCSGNRDATRLFGSRLLVSSGRPKKALGG